MYCSNVNTKKSPSTINELTRQLIRDTGIFIGVTATPGRLNLNNTHDNKIGDWIDLKPHEKYVGAETFFPTGVEKAEDLKYVLKTLPPESDDPRFLKSAIFRYIVNVAYLKRIDSERNYSMLIHTSGKVDIHKEDHKQLEKILNILRNKNEKKHEKYYKEIYDEAENKYKDLGYDIAKYIYQNITANTIIIMNSDKELDIGNNDDATNPKSTFTFIIGGNIVSRGVTFNNLLSMFFTRDAKA